jgi:cyclopropane-fatty-acyl-phospholipid synthase
VLKRRFTSAVVEGALAMLSRASDAPFEISLPGELPRRFGNGRPAFHIALKDQAALDAVASLDEMRIGEAYLDGHIDCEGDFVAALRLRAALSDKRPLAHFWATWGQRWVFGQANRDRKWIEEHYDNDPDFYLSFLDPATRCYSHGYFERDDDSLEQATRRKFDTAIAGARIKPGMRVLDIGAGWGAFTEYAGRLGVQVTSLTISKESQRFVDELIARERLPCRVLLDHLLEHRTDEKYDAIVNLGVTEHLPDYRATLAQYGRLLVPGGRVFLDACSARVKFPFASFVTAYIWPGNATPLCLSDYLRAVEDTPFELLSVVNDRRSYMLTTRRWAERLEENRATIVSRFGEHMYRRFRVYLWGCAHSFDTDNLAAYHWLLELPAEDRSRTVIERGRLVPWDVPGLRRIEDFFRH